MRAIPPCLVAVVMLLGLTSHAAAQGAPVIKWMRGGHSNYVTQLVHSSDGTFFVSGSGDRTVKIWRASDGLLLRTLIIPGGTLGIALSPDDSTVCAGGFSSPGNLPYIRCWNAADGAQLWSVPVPGALAGESISKLAFSPDGTRLALAVGNKLPILDASNGSFIADFAGTTPPNNFNGGLAYSPDGTVLAVNTAGDFPRLAFLNSSTGVKVWDSGSPSVSFGYDVAFSADGQYVASANGAGVHVFRNSDHVAQPFAAVFQTLNVGYAPSGTRLAAGGFGNLHLFNTSTGALIRSWAAHGNPGVDSTALTFTADSTKLISGLLDIKRWKASDGSFDALLTGQTAPVYLIAMSSDESVVATYTFNPSTDQHVLSLFRTADGSLLRYIEVGLECLRGLALSPDGKHLAAADNVQMRVWNVGSGALERSRTESGRLSFYRPLVYTPDGTKIAEGGDDFLLNVMLWNPTTDTETFLVAGPATVLRFLPSPDGRLVVARQIDLQRGERDQHRDAGRSHRPVALRLVVRHRHRGEPGRHIDRGRRRGRRLLAFLCLTHLARVGRRGDADPGRPHRLRQRRRLFVGLPNRDDRFAGCHGPHLARLRRQPAASLRHRDLHGVAVRASRNSRNHLACRVDAIRHVHVRPRRCHGRRRGRSRGATQGADREGARRDDRRLQARQRQGHAGSAGATRRARPVADELISNGVGARYPQHQGRRLVEVVQDHDEPRWTRWKRRRSV